MSHRAFGYGLSRSAFGFWRPYYDPDHFAILGGILTVSVLSVCGGAEADDLEDAAISSDDVPEACLPADLDETKGQALWDALPALLTENADARLILHAFEAESGLHGATTLLIETDDAAANPAAGHDDASLGPLGQLLESEVALLLPNPRGGDPNAYFERDTRVRRYSLAADQAGSTLTV